MPSSTHMPVALPGHAPAGERGVVVICGSMAHFAVMLHLQAQLQASGVEAIVPEDERHLTGLTISDRDYSKMKRRMSERYFRLIRRREVFAILVANYEKHGRANYIGPNTLAEIAIAVNARKKIYLAQDIYSELSDELIAWEAIPLKGSLATLLRDFRSSALTNDRQLVLDFQSGAR